LSEVKAKVKSLENFQEQISKKVFTFSLKIVL